MLKRYIGMFAVAMVTVHLPQSHVWCLVHSTLCSKAVLFFSAVLCSRLFQQQTGEQDLFQLFTGWIWSKSKYYFYFCSSSLGRKKNNNWHQLCLRVSDTYFMWDLLLPHFSLTKGNRWMIFFSNTVTVAATKKHCAIRLLELRSSSLFTASPGTSVCHLFVLHSLSLQTFFFF